MRKILLILMSLVLMMLPGMALSIPLVANGGFETGDFTGWTQTPASSGSLFSVTSDPDFRHSGSWGAAFGAVGNFDDSISQTLSTNAGQHYTLTFWLGHSSTDVQNDFHVSWDGSPVLDLVNVSSFIFTEYTYDVKASSPSTDLRFSGREVPAWFALDDVSVTAAAAVPEPATMLLLGSGLIGLAGYGRKKFFKK